MDFICACLLLFLWYVRPQDIFSAIGGVSVVKYLMYAGILVTIRRPGGFSLPKVFATPCDWLVGAYCLWAVYATEAHTEAAKEVFTYFSFHTVTALALSNWQRIETYVNVWLGCLATVALLAVSSHWGLELVGGSSELTTMFHERLTLNTWVFRNPNALGHGVMTLIPAGIAWFLMAGAKNRALGAVLVALAVHCVLLTESKGAFLACAAGVTMLFLFKRPVWLQLAILAAVYVVGLAALKSLPRMNTLSKSDEGIQGRMIVWQQAKATMEATKTGEGLKAFHGYVAVRIAKLHRTIHIPIATHGSYVRHGADLGYVGLMLFIGGFYLGARLLLQARTTPDGKARRVHRTAYTLVITTAVSCWVVDRAYHMDYFLLTGLLSAFHRRFLKPDAQPEEEGAGGTTLQDGRNIEGARPAASISVSASATPAPVPPSVSSLAGEGAPNPPVSPRGSASGPTALEKREGPRGESDLAVGTVAGGHEQAAPAGTRLPRASALAGSSPELITSTPEQTAAIADGTEADEHGVYRLNWKRISVLDLLAMYFLMEVVLYYWDLFSTDFIVF